MRVTAPIVYNGSLGGLCGNYNGQANDDFQTPDGTLVNSSQVFGDSWRNGSMAAQCVDSGSYNPKINYNSREYCGILGLPQGPFSKCWDILDQWKHIQICNETVKFSSNPAVVICEVLRDFALSCQQKGLVLGLWRNATGCGEHVFIFY